MVEQKSHWLLGSGRIALLAVGFALVTLAVGTAVVRLDWVERPSDKALIQTFIKHRSAFNSLVCQQSGPVIKRKLEGTGGVVLSCNYDGSFRVLFGGNHFGSAVGPGWVKGLTFIPRNAARYGVLVSSTDQASKLHANVYLRQIYGNWFIFYQRNDN